ncbi:MAG: hypothetical protein Q4B26_18975 [Eubacteriales bacterium]|nr:hypothetical protein [Eubacteriales bacterium]
MKKVLMNLQNYLFADAVERSLREDGDFIIVNVSDSDDVIHQCELTSPEVIFMEVTGYLPWRMSERMKIRKIVKGRDPNCKVVLMVNENTEEGMAEQIIEAKLNGEIDGFVYSSVSASYLSALLQTV